MTSTMKKIANTFHVVINDEGQYSVVPLDFPGASGWRECGIMGTKSECLDYIERNWDELLPRSVRDQCSLDA